MGGGLWDTDAYVSAATTRRKTGTADFDYHAKVASGKASGIHPDLDPSKVAGPTSPLAGQPIRESRDGPDHPESLPIVAIFDVTGSNIRAARVLQQKLPKLMDVILDKAKIKDPQVLVGAVGDSTCDRYPFQVGQFESDNRFDEQLRNIILEGGGGGQVQESYALAYRFAADHTATDAYEKRGKKGYFFTMGDEAPWPTVKASDVQKIFGISAEKDEKIEDLIARAEEKWEIYHIFCMDGSYDPATAGIGDRWATLLGERFVKIEHSDLICEFIAGIIAMLESRHTVDTVVDTDLGLTGDDAAAVKRALVTVAASRVPAHVAAGAVPAGHGSGPGGVSRV